MGSYFGLTIVVRKENLASAVQQLYKHTTSDFNTIAEERLPVGRRRYKNQKRGYYLSDLERPGINLEIIRTYPILLFWTSIWLDADPAVEAYFEEDASEGWNIEEMTGPDGRIKIGGFDGTIQSFDYIDSVGFQLTAVTSAMSYMLTQSPSAKSWIRNFSRSCDALIGYIECEYEPAIVVYLNGRDMEDRRFATRDEVEPSSITPEWEPLYAFYDPR